jgi:hypothetical protein
VLADAGGGGEPDDARHSTWSWRPWPQTGRERQRVRPATPSRPARSLAGESQLTQVCRSRVGAAECAGQERARSVRPPWGARRKEAAIINTPPSELDGTAAGIVITAIVATLGLVILLGMVYWANSHPDVRKPKAGRPGKAHRPVTAEPRRAVPSPEKPGSTSSWASAASSPAQALDREPTASRRDKSGLPVIIFAGLTSLFTLTAWLLRRRRRTSGRPQDHPGH